MRPAALWPSPSARAGGRYYAWPGTTHDMVPTYATSIEGVTGLIFSRDESDLFPYVTKIKAAAPDAVITAVDVPAVLLTNITERSGHWLVLRLVGTTTHRDAIGAQVTVRADGKTRVHQLTAGDGYLVSNQKQLVIGTGTVTRLDAVSIRWPSGLDQDLGPVDTDRTLKVIEGRKPLILGGKN